MKFEDKTITAAIFDMDGTMFDTERIRMNMLKAASGQLVGEKMSDRILVDSLGLSAKSAEDLARKEYGADYPYQAIREKADELETEYIRVNGVPVKNGLYDVLERLKKNGVLLAVATSSRRAIVEEYLISADIQSYFDIIVCGDEVEHGKPHPEIFLRAAEELNCDPAHCFVFEDSENGLLSASRAGTIPIFVKDMKEPRPEVKKLAFRSFGSMLEFLDQLVDFTKRYSVPKLSEVFPQRFNNIKIGIHGFGAIGGGYLTQVFSYWDGYTRPSVIVGATRSKALRQICNSFGKYNVHYSANAVDQEIDHVHLIDMNDKESMNRMYAQSDLIALCLPESAIRSQAKTIAGGLLYRHAKGGGSLTVLIAMNKINSGSFVRNQVRRSMEKISGSEKAADALKNVCFSETVINRIVSKTPLDTQLKQAQRGLRTLSDSQPDASGVSAGRKVTSISKTLRDLLQRAREISNIHITMFYSGSFMPLYVGKGSPLLGRLRQVEQVEDIGKMQKLKIQLSNGPHAIAAWYSSLLGFKSIGQGMGDKRVHALVEHLMHDEVKPVVMKTMPEFSGYIDNFIETFIQRCRSSFRDPCSRVGRNPLRKLQRNERIFSTIDLARSYHIATPLLEFGAAAGILYGISRSDSRDKECLRMRELYEERHSVRDILLYSGPYNGKPYRCLDAQKDTELVGRIEKQFDALKKLLMKTDSSSIRLDDTSSG